MRLDNPLDDLLRTGSHVRILRVLNDLPGGLAISAREIARRAGVSHTTGSTVLRSLADQGTVHVQRSLASDSYEMNRSHVLFRRLHALLDSERKLRDELLTLLREQVEGRAPAVQDAYLFGSAVRPRAMMATSDIDVAVICQQVDASGVEGAMERVAATVRARFGNNLNTVIGTSPIEQLVRRDHPGNRLWARIADTGIQLLGGKESTTHASAREGRRHLPR